MQSILVELQTDISHHSKSAGNHELKFNTLNSKVRILEKKTIRAYEAEKPHVSKSKKERSAEIEAKIQKVVQNFNKSISRHNSRKSISSSQKISKADKKAKEKPDQRSDVCREDGSVEVSQNSQKGPSETSGATQAIQNLNLTSQATERPGGDFFKEFTLQFPEKQLSRFSKENDIFKADPVQKHPDETYGNNKFSQNPQGFSSTSKAIEPAENITSNRDKSSPFHGDLSNKLRDDVPKEKSTFEISASGRIFSVLRSLL